MDVFAQSFVTTLMSVRAGGPTEDQTRFWNAVFFFLGFLGSDFGGESVSSQKFTGWVGDFIFLW